MKFTVLGAGNGGQAFAGHLSLLDHDVSLFDVDAERVAELNRKGAIELSGSSTVCKLLTPQASRIFTALAEKPHCG